MAETPPLTEALATTARMVEVALDALLPQPVGDEAALHRAMRHSAEAGGKRLRAFLAIESASLFDVDPASSVRTAAAIECLHTYSLIHDDLPAMDDATTRRGKPACHVAFDEATAILAGDALQALAFEILATPDTHPDARVRADLVLGLAKAAGAAGMCAGQMADLEGERLPLDLESTLRMEQLKTGALIAFSLEAGAILGQADDDARTRLRTFGEALGLAFQIRDDQIDITGDPAMAGKDLGLDQAAGKATPLARLGAEGIARMMQELEHQAMDSIAVLGDRAERLREAYRFAVNRAS
ncbi:polyprenyl synthetase family protein [Marinivivus vitaminiproducens]|uniref:polyprenyl synthetase family protein n=1 Tax=Marinivivus vitaminiproducens TaxID=3035935 RepID=UPI0027A03521|nr:polyprenyl synthetase family protein [Geminicoccaceae bacterium SCSIO 64248]